MGSRGLEAIPELVADTAVLSRGPAERTHVGVEDTHNLRGNRQGVLMGPGSVLWGSQASSHQPCPRSAPTLGSVVQNHEQNSLGFGCNREARVI